MRAESRFNRTPPTDERWRSVRRVLRDERGFFLFSAAKTGFKFLKKGVKVAVGAALTATGLKQPPAYVPTATPSAGPPATSTTSPQPYTPPLEKIKQDLLDEVRKVATQTGNVAAEAFVKPIVESEAIAKRQRMVYIAAGVGGLLLVTILIVTLTRSK